MHSSQGPGSYWRLRLRLYNHALKHRLTLEKALATATAANPEQSGTLPQWDSASLDFPLSSVSSVQGSALGSGSGGCSVLVASFQGCSVAALRTKSTMSITIFYSICIFAYRWPQSSNILLSICNSTSKCLDLNKVGMPVPKTSNCYFDSERVYQLSPRKSWWESFVSIWDLRLAKNFQNLKYI